MGLLCGRPVFDSRRDLLEFLNKQPRIVVADDRVTGEITVVSLCSEDAKICGDVNRWIFIDGEFMHSTTISRDSSLNEDDFFKMICLCNPHTIRELEKLCMNHQLGISLADFFKAGQFLQSLDKQAIEAVEADEAGHLPTVSELAWKTLHYEHLSSPSENTISCIQHAFQIAIDGIRGGCDRCRGIVSYMLMKHSDQALKYPLSKPITKLLLKYHLHCIRTPNEYTLFVNGIRMLSTNEVRGIELIKMAAERKLEVAECWMGDYCEKQMDYAKMLTYYSESAKRTGYLPAIMGRTRALNHFKAAM